MEATTSRLTALINLLQAQPVAFATWSEIEWSTYDTFQTVYGQMLYEAGGVTADGLSALNYINGMSRLIKIPIRYWYTVKLCRADLISFRGGPTYFDCRR